MKILKKVVHILAIISYILIFIYVITCIPYLFKHNPLVVLSGSMEPTFKEGSIIYYKNIENEEIKKDDIVIYTTKKDDDYVSHRVVNIEGDLYTTKGDANNVVDLFKVERQNIKGKYTGITIPYLGYYIKFINEHLNIIGGIIIILIAEFLLTNTGILGKRKEKI